MNQVVHHTSPHGSLGAAILEKMEDSKLYLVLIVLVIVLFVDFVGILVIFFNYCAHSLWFETLDWITFGYTSEFCDCIFGFILLDYIVLHCFIMDNLGGHKVLWPNLFLY